MARGKLRPVDVIGILPDLAAISLEKEDAHPISVVRLGALTFNCLELREIMGPSVSERQISESCLGLVLFFNRIDISEDHLTMKTHLDLTPEVRFFAKGIVLHHRVMVKYVGAFTDATRSIPRWIALPEEIKDWFGDPANELNLFSHDADEE